LETAVLEFWSPGGYTVDVSPSATAAIVLAAEESHGLETGGILLGRYSIHGEAAVVEKASGPPTDSRRGPKTFWRGIAGVGNKLRNLWENRTRYYLGEWHYHPSSAAVPSRCDLNEMMEIARSPGYSCPEPILLIVGGDEEMGWDFSLRVFEDRHGEVILARQ
jgi:integrative and conjugative element protein (TIGR02256 family)